MTANKKLTPICPNCKEELSTIQISTDGLDLYVLNIETGLYEYSKSYDSEDDMRKLECGNCFVKLPEKLRKQIKFE